MNDGGEAKMARNYQSKPAENNEGGLQISKPTTINVAASQSAQAENSTSTRPKLTTRGVGRGLKIDVLDCEPRLQQRSANTVVNYITAMMTKVQLTWQDRASPGSESATVRMEIWPVRSWQTKKPVRSGMKKPARTAVFGSLKTVSRLRRRVAPLRAEYDDREVADGESAYDCSEARLEFRVLDKSVVKVGRGVGVKGERAGKKEDVEDTDDDEWEVGWKRVSAKAKREVKLYFGSRHLLGSRFGAFMAARSLPLFGHKHFDGYAVVVLPSQTDRMVNREEFRHRRVRERERDRDRGSCRICAFTNYTGK
ncbi:uncharacterized protein UMAG_03757 [Mycosarcoma maydis]|uniref:Uncharacterized protein n=1 Tax=Mycosarcoma maydis TaxID=5270 RepID=A0A0D1C396_MYCMD|nr:uncharacterized protein UMAG_03757 [Ustilago maydis 521]KIS68177.1 hypothetical protein UMAG_03757 [Ustilago maydis 521]|eukprot:XP_011390210.1 hypothetical protein UMAG_03757 [Ustilago maydis 521]